MKRQAWLISAALAVAFLLFYFSGLPVVPFHPDESSQISLSGDFSSLFLQGDWASLAWSPDQPATPEMQLRLLDAPMTRYLIGLSDWLHGFSPAELNTDWVWWLSWDENVAAGHLPSTALLLASRVPAAILSALAVAVMFFIVSEIRGPRPGLAAALFLGANPLVMLHGRRAMAEGALLFFSLLAIWGAVRLVQASEQNRRTVPRLGLLGLGVGLLTGLAVCSKQSGLGLLLAASAAVVLPNLRLLDGVSFGRRLSRLFITWLALGLGCALAFWALNPVLYRHPLGGLQVMIAARADLLREQTVAQLGYLPETVTPDLLTRLRAALLEVYLRPPAVWDVPVYLNWLQPQAEAYLAQPMVRLTANPAWGILMAGLGAAGLAFSAGRLWRDRLRQTTSLEQALWWWAMGVLGVVLLTTPFDWQRYFILLVPPACVFAALGLEGLAGPTARLVFGRHLDPKRG